MARSSSRIKGRENSEFPTDPKTLQVRLEEVFKELTERKEQKEEGRIDRRLHFLKEQLIRPHIIASKNKTVRQFAARSIVHLLFLYAPELPYNDSEIKRIFLSLVQLLKGLEKDPKSTGYECAFEILEKLALYRMSCTLIDATDSSRDTVLAEDIVVSIFDTLLDVVGVNHPHQVDEFIVEVLSTLIEEHDQISPKLIDALLCRLLPERRNESEKAYVVASRTVKRCTDYLREPISAFVNNAITGGDLALIGLDGEEADMSELKDHIHDLIYALHEVDPNLTLYILPNVANQLEVDEFDVRFKAVQLMCLIFHSSPAVYVCENERLWTQLLRRIRDKNLQIRYEIVKFVGYMISDHSDSIVFSRHFIQGLALADAVELVSDLSQRNSIAIGDVRNRLSLGQGAEGRGSTNKGDSVLLLERAILDSEETVREEAVLCIVEHTLTRENLALTNASLLRKLAERFHDKKLDIASSAAEGLGKAFAKHVAPSWLHSDENPDIDEKLGWVPDELLKAFFNQLGSQDTKRQRLSLMRIIDEYLLGKKLPAADRAVLLAKVWHSLSPMSRTAMKRLCFDQRHKLQSTMRGLLEKIKRERKKPSNTAKVKSELEQLAKQVVLDKSASGLLELIKVRDQYVFRHLALLSSTMSARGEIKTCATDLYERLGSKSGCTRAMKYIVPRMAMLTVGLSEVACLVSMLQKYANPENVEQLSSLCHLLNAIFQSFPSLACTHEVFQPLHEVVERVTNFASSDAKLEANESQNDVVEDVLEDGGKREEHGVNNVKENIAHIVLQSVCCITEIWAGPTTKTENEQLTKATEALKVALLNACTTDSISSARNARKCTKALMFLDHENLAREQFDTVDELLKRHNTKRLLESEDLRSEVSLSIISVILLKAPQAFTVGAVGSEAHLCPNRSVRRSFAMVKAAYLEEGTQSGPRRPGTIDQQLKLKVAAIKVISSELLRRTKFPLEGKLSKDKYIPSQSMVVLLRKIISDLGDPWGGEKVRKELVKGSRDNRTRWPPPSANHFAQLRLSAGSEILRLTGDISGAKVLLEGSKPKEVLEKRAQRWVELSRIAMDPCDEIREEFAEKLMKFVVGKGKQPFFLGVLLVFVNAYCHDGKRKHQTGVWMNQLIRSLSRKYYSKIMQSTQHDETELQSQFVTLAPECMLPNLTFLLAHHPALPTEKVKRDSFLMNPDNQRLITRPLTCLLDALATVHKENNAGSNTNSGILFAMLNTMRSKSDILATSSVNIHVVNDIASQLIHRRVKIVSDTLSFQGQVPLPPVYVEQSTLEDCDPSEFVSFLPQGFELALGAKHARMSQATGGQTAAKGRAIRASIGSRRRSLNRKRTSAVVEKVNDQPTRRQPRRASRGTNVPSYVEVDSDVDMKASHGGDSSDEEGSEKESDDNMPETSARSHTASRNNVSSTESNEKENSNNTQTPNSAKRKSPKQHARQLSANQDEQSSDDSPPKRRRRSGRIQSRLTSPA